MTGFNNKWNGFAGTVPEFGAIFMSSASTKEECLSRKLFGLPSSQASFVKLVKEGMILFLFEFEKRQLHGVFRASCDGALDIEPRAYSSSGQQFPAQVKFTQIWHSEPLSEHEFRDAIIDNYFSSKKFNFGLSRDQVHKLLLLFNSRKLNQIPERQSTRSNVKRSMWQPPGKPKGSVDGHRLLARGRAEFEFGAENYGGPFYSRDSFDEVERECDSGLAITNGDEYCPDPCVEPPLVQSNHYLRDYPMTFGRVGDDGDDDADNDLFAARDRVKKSGQIIFSEYPLSTLSKPLGIGGDSRFCTSYDGLRNGCNVEKGIIRHDISTDCFSTLSSPGYSSNPKLDREVTVEDQLTSSSTIFRPMQPQLSNHSYSNYCKDAIVRNSLSSYEPRYPSLSYSTSHQDATVRNSLSSFEPRHPSFSYSTSHQDATVRNFLSSFEPRYPSLSYSTSHQDATVTTSKVKRSFPNLDSASTISYDPDAPGYNTSSSFASRYSSGSAQECAPRESCPKNIFPLLKSQPFSTDMEHNTSLNDHESSYWRGIEFSGDDGYRSFPFPRPSSNTALYSEGCYRRVDDKEYLSYSLSPSGKNKLLKFGNFGYEYPLDDIYEKNEKPLSENRKMCDASVSYSKDDECWKPDCTQFAEPKSVDYQEHVSMDYGLINTQGSRSISYDDHKKRNSVFSRLTLPPRVYGQQKGSFDEDGTEMDMSVDEVMAVVPWQTCNQREKAKRSRPVTKEFNDVETNRKEHTISSSKVEKDCLTIIFEDTRMNDTSTGEKRTEETPFYDFKRRNQVQKINEETKSRGCIESADNGASSGRQHKRRKLIRPKFSEIVSSDGEHANDDSVQNFISSVLEDINVARKASGDTEANENRSSQHVELPHNTCSISREDKNEHSEVVGLNCEGSLRKGAEDEFSAVQGSVEIGGPSSEPECGGATHKNLLQEIENSDKLCPINGEMTVHGMMIKSSNLNLDTENIPERVLNVSVNEECEKSLCLSFLSSNEQPRAPDEPVRCSPMQDISQETFDSSVRDTEVLKTVHGDEDCAVAIFQKVENRNQQS